METFKIRQTLRGVAQLFETETKRCELRLQACDFSSDYFFLLLISVLQYEREFY